MNNTAVIVKEPVRLGDSEPFRAFKEGVDSLLDRRRYFISKVLPLLKLGRDYFEIKGRKSLGKSGAEKIASIFGYVAEFRRDTEMMSAFGDMPGVISLICDLTKDGKLVGQGRGASTIEKSDGDINKALKMSEKSSFISAVVRSSGLSDLFSQDLENLDPSLVTPAQALPEDIQEIRPTLTITDRQKALLESLIYQNVPDHNQADTWVASLDELTRAEASDQISSFIGTK